MIQILKELGSYDDEEFICPWYTIMIFLEILEENPLILKINGSIKGKEIFFDIRQDFKKYRLVIIYLINKPNISAYFKSKILKKLDYNITILKEKTHDKKTIIEKLLLEEDYSYFDILVKEVKASDNCKAFDIDEMEETIILEISHQIVKKKTLQIFQISKSKDPGNEIKDFKQLKEEIIKFCIIRKMNEVTKILFRRYPNEALTVNIIILALENDCFEYLKEIASLKRIRKILVEKRIMIKITSLLKSPESFLDGVFFLYDLKEMPLIQELQKILYDTFREIIKNPEKNRIFLYNLNPLLIFTMLSKILDSFSKNCFNYQHSFRTYSLFMGRIAADIVKKYDNFYSLKKMLYEVFYPSKIPLIEILFENKDLFQDFFQDDRLVKITRLQLNNFYDYDWNVFACSTSFKYASFNRTLQNTNSIVKKEKNDKISDTNLNLKIFHNFSELIEKTLNQEKEKIGILKIFDYISKLKIDEVNKGKNHIYQYKIYFKSISYRIIFEVVIFFGLFVYLHVNTNEYSTIRANIVQIDNNYINFMNSMTNSSLYNITEHQSVVLHGGNVTIHCINELTSLLIGYNMSLVNDYHSSCIQFHNELINYETTTSNLITLSCVIIAIECNLFLRKFYQIYVQKRISFLLIDQLDLLSIAFLIVIVVLNVQSIDEVFLYPEALISNINPVCVFVALLLFTFWLILFQYLKLSKQFGYIIKTLEMLIKETYVFLWIFFLFIAAFSSINLILFGSFYTKFSAFFLGIVNLFSYALGNYEFIDGYSNYYTVISAIINIIYILFTNVILINLLIALLSSIYQVVSNNSDMEYSSIIYELREEKNFHKTYGSIMLYPRTINIFLLPIHAITLLLKSPKFNLFIGSIGYFVSLPCYFIMFLISHIIFIPIAWFNILILIFRGNYQDNLISKNVTWLSKILHILVWLSFGMLHLLYVLIFYDSNTFFKNAFYSKQKNKIPPITLVEYSSLTTALKQIKYFEKDLNTEDFITNYLQIFQSVEASDNQNFKNSIEFFKQKKNSIFDEIKLQEANSVGAEILENKNKKLIHFKKMIEIIESFSIDGQICIKALDSVMKSLKNQIKQRKNHKKKEINKLAIVNYREILGIFLDNLESFNPKK